MRIILTECLQIAGNNATVDFCKRMNAKSAEKENKTKQGCPKFPHFERDQGDDFEHVTRLFADCEYKKGAEAGENLWHSQIKAVLNRLKGLNRFSILLKMITKSIKSTRKRQLRTR